MRSTSMKNFKTIAVENKILGREFSEPLPLEVFLDTV